MKEEIIVTVSYIVKMERNSFWNPETRRLNDEIKEELECLFPSQVNLGGKLIKRNSLSHWLFCKQNNHIQKCVFCGKWTRDAEGYHLSPLRDMKKINEKPYCSSCAWETEHDLKMK